MSRDVCYLRWKLLMIIVNNIGEKVVIVFEGNYRMISLKRGIILPLASEN